MLSSAARVSTGRSARRTTSERSMCPASRTAPAPCRDSDLRARSWASARHPGSVSV